MSESSHPYCDYCKGLQELIRDLITTGWGEVVLSLTPIGEYEDQQFAVGLQRLIEEFELKPEVEHCGDMVGFFFGYMPPFTD